MGKHAKGQLNSDYISNCSVCNKEIRGGRKLVVRTCWDCKQIRKRATAREALNKRHDKSIEKIKAGLAARRAGLLRGKED